MVDKGITPFLRQIFIANYSKNLLSALCQFGHDLKEVYIYAKIKEIAYVGISDKTLNSSQNPESC